MFSKFCKHILLSLLLLVALSSNCFAYSLNVVPTGEIPSHQVDYVVEGVNKTLTYMNKVYGLNIDKDITINVTSNLGASTVLSNSEMNNNVGGKSKDGEVNLVINPQSGRYYIVFLTAHELIHQYQLSNYGSYAVLNKNMWFTEGMADYLGAKIASSIDPSMWQKFVDNAKIKSMTHNLKLVMITDKASWRYAFSKKQEPYSKADLAMIYLFEQYPDLLMFTYFNHLYSETADTALKNVFNISIAELDDAISGYSSDGMVSTTDELLEDF